MNRRDFELAVGVLVEEGLRLPYDHFPGSYPGGERDVRSTRALWDDYVWGGPEDATGPQYLAHLKHFAGPDLKASPKPTRSELLAALARARTKQHEAARADIVLALDAEARRLISAAYGASAWEQEVHLRLRGGHTPEQDAERERLRGVHDTLRRRVRAATTSADLAAIDREIHTAATWTSTEEGSE